MDDAKQVAFASKPLTAGMMKAGLSWLSFRNYAEKSIELIKENGDSVLEFLDTAFRAFSAVTEFDMKKVFDELGKATVDLEALIAAIRETFDL